jgi:hypothetical protein
MIRSLLLAFALILLPAFAPATAAEAAGPALQPFIARCEVYRGGDQLGEATLQLVRPNARQWRVDLLMHGTGLLRMAGIKASQSTVFTLAGKTYRPLTQAAVRKVLFTDRQTVGIYDWRSRSARWQGDLKESRREQIALQPGDMTGLLINLAVVRDAEPGKTLRYRFVEDGRAKPHVYVVAEQTESVEVDGMGYSAMRVERIEDENEQTIIWVVKGVPTPVRILQREDGEAQLDLRLTQYREVTPEEFQQ